MAAAHLASPAACSHRPRGAALPQLPPCGPMHAAPMPPPPGPPPPATQLAAPQPPLPFQLSSRAGSTRSAPCAAGAAHGAWRAGSLTGPAEAVPVGVQPAAGPPLHSPAAPAELTCRLRGSRGRTRNAAAKSAACYIYCYFLLLFQNGREAKMKQQRAAVSTVNWLNLTLIALSYILFFRKGPPKTKSKQGKRCKAS